MYALSTLGTRTATRFLTIAKGHFWTIKVASKSCAARVFHRLNSDCEAHSWNTCVAVTRILASNIFLDVAAAMGKYVLASVHHFV